MYFCDVIFHEMAALLLMSLALLCWVALFVQLLFSAVFLYHEHHFTYFGCPPNQSSVSLYSKTDRLFFVISIVVSEASNVLIYNSIVVIAVRLSYQ